jgi:hypothetical protein
MLRRVCAIVLMLACAFAPALTGHASTEKAESCCCGAACPCPPQDCAPPPAAPLRVSLAADANSVQQRTHAAKPAARAALALAWFLSLSDARTASALPVSATTSIPVADSVALFQAHCSLLL